MHLADASIPSDLQAIQFVLSVYIYNILFSFNIIKLFLCDPGAQRQSVVAHNTYQLFLYANIH